MDKQDELVRQTRWELGHTRRIWQADRQGAWYACISLLVFWGAFTMMQHRLWHSQHRKQRWGCIGIDKVDQKPCAKELMAGVPAHQQGSLNTEGEQRQERICVSTLQKCHVSTESMFKEGKRTDLFIFHDINTHTFLRFYDAILMTVFFRLGDTFGCQSTRPLILC